MNYQPSRSLLSGKTIFVTGATNGIGLEAATTYARYGADVILSGRNHHKLQRVVTNINAQTVRSARAYPLDLATLTAESCQQYAQLLMREITQLDGVLLNASVLGEITPLVQLNPATWQHVIQVNVHATFYLIQALLPLLLKSPLASLILTSSSVGRKGRAGWGAYSVSKFATEGLMQVLAAEYQQHNLRVNCINPGATRTKMRASAFPHEDAHRLKTPAEIMPLYLYLMSDDSREENGASFDAQADLKR